MIRKKLIIPKQKPTGDTGGRLWHSLLILFHQTARTEEVLRLSCQAWLFLGRGRREWVGGARDKSPPFYLCVKRSHRSGGRSKNERPSVFSTLAVPAI